MTQHPGHEKSVTIVVPTFREAGNIGELIQRLADAMNQTRYAWDALIVDDDSRDGTSELVETITENGAPVRLITRVDERGLSSAVIRGFREARGDLLVCMDGDLSHPPEDIPKLLNELDDGETDFVIGSRYAPGGSTDEGWGLLRRINSRAATLLARPFTSARDPMAGFFALRRDTFLNADKLSPIGYKIGLELIVKCECRKIIEVPIRFAQRKQGESKLTFSEQVRYLRHINRLARHKFGALAWLAWLCIVAGTAAVVGIAACAVVNLILSKFR